MEDPESPMCLAARRSRVLSTVEANLPHSQAERIVRSTRLRLAAKRTPVWLLRLIATLCPLPSSSMLYSARMAGVEEFLNNLQKSKLLTPGQWLIVSREVAGQRHDRPEGAPSVGNHG